jgi:hypothetical protein
VKITYRSKFTLGGGLLFIGEYSRVNGSVLVNRMLPETNDKLQTMRVITQGPNDETMVLPVVRNLGLGQFWIQSVTVRPILCIDGQCG